LDLFKETSVKKNDLITLDITDINTEGNGVGRYQGMAVFVPTTAPGDRVRCRIVKVQSRFCYGIAEEIEHPSALRCENDCPVYPRCGGCSLRHISYEAECAIKAGWVAENMRRIGGVTAEVLPILPSPNPMRYRNKAIYPIGRSPNGEVVAGFYARRSHRIVPHSDCLLQPELFSCIRRTVVDFISRHNLSVYDESEHRGLVRALFLRMGEATGEVMLCLVLNGSTLPHADAFVSELRQTHQEISTIVLNENTRRTNVVLGDKTHILYGDGLLEDRLYALRFELSAESFYQVNRSAAQLLYERVGELCNLSGSEVVVDLYCGAGTIGLSLAHKAGQVIGVEIVPEAIENARQNATINGITNARFITGDAAKAAQDLAAVGLRPDVVLVDPPRKGLSPTLIGTIAKMAPERVVMVSCNSATAARDTALFDRQGYTARLVQPVDMFPRSAHVECVVLMSRMDK
jgi:23S rRNA (uracil1939-C5)-methyltransferase